MGGNDENLRGDEEVVGCKKYADQITLVFCFVIPAKNASTTAAQAIFEPRWLPESSSCVPCTLLEIRKYYLSVLSSAATPFLATAGPMRETGVWNLRIVVGSALEKVSNTCSVSVESANSHPSGDRLRPPWWEAGMLGSCRRACPTRNACIWCIKQREGALSFVLTVGGSTIFS